MLTTEELELLIKVTNAIELERLTKALLAEEAAMLATVKAGVLAAGGQAAFEASIAKSNAEITNLTASLSGMQSASGMTAGQLNGLNSSIRNVGFGISDVFSNNGPLGQKIQGFGNNVGQMVTGVLAMMGKLTPAGLAAAAALEIGVTATGAALTAFGIKSVSDFVRLFTGGVKEVEDRLEGLNDKIKELEKKPVKLAVDLLELQNAHAEVDAITAGIAAFEAFRKAQSTPDKESGAAVRKEFAENRGNEAVEQIRKMMVNEQAEQSAPLKEARDKQRAAEAEISRLRANPGWRNAGQLHDDIKEQEAIREAAAEQARKILTDITKTGEGKNAGSAQAAAGILVKRATEGQGDELQRAQDELQERLRRVGRDDLAGKVRANSPAARREWDEGADWQARQEEEDDKAEALRLKLQVQGQTNKALADKAAEKQKDKDDKAEEKMRKAVAGASVREVHEVAPKALHGVNAGQAERLLEGNIARGIQQDYGANPMQAAAAAQRSVQLQHQGVNHIEATQRAVHELMNGMLSLEAKLQHLSGGTHDLGKRANEVTAKMRTNLSRTGS